MRCDCGWVARVPQFDGTRPLSRDEIEQRLERQFLAHIPAGELRTYLLLDTRPPQGCDDLVNDDGTPIIVGNFAMPEGVPVQLLSTDQRDGVHYGRFKIAGEDEAELPIGEVRTPEGRVFRLDE